MNEGRGKSSGRCRCRGAPALSAKAASLPQLEPVYVCLGPGGCSGLAEVTPTNRATKCWLHSSGGGEVFVWPHLALPGHHPSEQTPALSLGRHPHSGPLPASRAPAPRWPLSWCPWLGPPDPAGSYSVPHSHVPKRGVHRRPLGCLQGRGQGWQPFLDTSHICDLTPR